MSPAPHADRDHSEAPETDILTAARREAERLTEAIYRQEAAIDRARMERAQAEDAETAATERAEAAEAERDRARSLAATLEARLAQVEAAVAVLDEVAFAQIALDHMLTVMPTGPYRAAVAGHWRDETERRVRPYREHLRAALKGDA